VDVVLPRTYGDPLSLSLAAMINGRCARIGR